MIKIFLMLAAMVSLISAAEASDIPDILLNGTDSLVYLPDDSSGRSVVLHRGNNFYSFYPNNPHVKSSADDGVTLDVPANDDCFNAQAIGEVDSMPINLNDATFDGGDFTELPNVWFVYTATITDRIRIAIDDSYNNYSGGNHVVYEGGTCPEFENLPDPVLIQGGESIESAVPITGPLPISYSGTLSGYLRDYTECSCIVVQQDFFGPDVVYSYTANADDSINIVLAGSGADLALVIYDDAGHELACSRWVSYQTPDGPASSIHNFPVHEGETYYIIIVCPIGTSPEIDYTLTMFSPDYTILNRNILDVHYTDLTIDAVAGHQYMIEVGLYQPDETDIYLSVEPAPDPPENDNYENALDGGTLVAGSTIEFVGDNTGATTQPISVTHLPDVWVKFTLEDTLNIMLDYCGITTIGDFFIMSTIISDGLPTPDSWVNIDTEWSFVECPQMMFSYYRANLPPGTYYYPMLVHHSFEGPYIINIKGMETQECEDTSLYGQEPSSISFYSNGNFIQSDYETGGMAADKFQDTGGFINKITWWGITADPQGEAPCEPESPYPFRIIIFNTNETSPYLPGDTAADYDISIVPEETGYWVNYLQDNEKPQKKFIAELPDSLEINDGWIMIVGNYSYNECLFYWQDSDIAGTSLIYNAIEERWSSIDHNLAFCIDYVNSVSIDDDFSQLPSTVELLQNYPNPFNAKTSIQFSLKTADDISLSIYDIGGRLIKSLYDGTLSAGTHNVIWNGTNESGEAVSSGIYFYKLTASEVTYINRMVLLK